MDIVPTPDVVADTDRLGDQICELAAHLEAATARLLDLLREFDAREGWNTGFRSCAHWLAYRAGMDLGAARERVRTARALGGLPLLAAAFARAELSYAKVRALTRVATPETEERLLKVGLAGSACQVERIVRGWRRVDRAAETRQEGHRHKHRALRVYQDADGMVVVRGLLTPEQGAVLLQALEAARETLYQRTRGTASGPQDLTSEPSSIEQHGADALTLVAECALHHELDPAVRRNAQIPATGRLAVAGRCTSAGDHGGSDPGAPGAKRRGGVVPGRADAERERRVATVRRRARDRRPASAGAWRTSDMRPLAPAAAPAVCSPDTAGIFRRGTSPRPTRMRGSRRGAWRS